MQLSDESIEEFKAIHKKHYGTELGDAKARESAQNLMNFVKALYDCWKTDIKRKWRLKTEPNGFHLTDGTYNCSICYTAVTGEKSWYDKWGAKCLLCQKAVETGAVPGFACRDCNSRYLIWNLKSDFGIHSSTVRKMVREGKLKARIVMSENDQPYEYVFLKKENPRLVHRYSPERKSRDRNRKKENARMEQEWKLKIKEESKKKPKTARYA